MEINEKVRTLRELNHLSQEEMAAKLEMSTNGYAKIERGQRRLDIPKLEQIAAVFNMDLIDLLNFDDKRIVCLVSENTVTNTKHGVLYQINHDSQQNTYYGAEELTNEIEKLNLMLAHKDELLAQKEREIDLLQNLVNALKHNS
ncbi:helix-turn-helix domain-containing protein [Wielerella bovis]|uniref:helix-turn-helix domain-containing protein n=1 Tax=Wielerella bovis TaxID=2917790 RepID=UPI0020198143|nr:helix-turn-helix transcriptional regulator [Wielerella bovis]ULJ59789.1 helix-turn-helix domain-containing protein [Wielerella bovis]